MSYCLLLKDKVINENDIIDVVFENNIVDLVTEPKSSKNVTKAIISKIDHKLKNFYIFLIDYGSGIYIPIKGSHAISIIEKDELNGPNIRFKHGYSQSWS